MEPESDLKQSMPEPVSSISGSALQNSTVEYFYALPHPEGPPPRERYWLHVGLLIATIFTTLIVGARMQFNFLHNLPPFTAGNEYLPFFPVGWALSHPSRLVLGIPFSATLLAILLAHEMGHYLLCRYYGVHATLPFFIPAPTLIGTLGAVIRIKAPIRSRAALFDIGIAGPIAGFVVAIATLIVSMTLSKPYGPGMAASDLRLGFPAIFYLVHDAMRTTGLESAIAALPLRRVCLHPTAIAAWVGMFATALNLLPSSQLDGGHIVYSLAPRIHRAVSWATVVALLYLGRTYVGWWVWAGLLIAMNILTFRQKQAPVFPLFPRNRWTLAILALLMLLLTFTISPFQMNLR
jgi:membrane-associated protease RseP (regulator of RpoE activity)